MTTGHQVIETALAKAAKGEWNNSPAGMSPEQGVAYQQGLAAAYQHALEMLPVSEMNRMRAIIDEVHCWIVCAAICTPQDMAGNFEHITKITAPEDNNETDSERLEWLLPVITGEVSHRANQRTGALGACLMCGLDGRIAIDKAMGMAK